MSFSAYPAYKSSGVEWLGEVPEHWTVIALKWLSPVFRGASPRPIDDPIYFDDDGEFGWVRIADVTASPDGYLYETTQRLSALGSSLSVKLEPGELFLSIAGSVGKPCITAVKACIHDGFVYFPWLSIDQRLLYRVFESGLCFGGLGKMGTQLNLNTDTVGGICIAVPPESELSRVLAFLDHETARIDALIEDQQRLIELLKEKRQAVISQAVTKGLDPTAPMKDSGVEWLGGVPAHWDVKRLKHLCSDIKAGPFGSALTKDMYVATGYKIYGQEQVIPGNFDIGDYYIDEERYASLRQYQVRSGDVLISCVGTFGKIAVVPEAVEPGIINPRLIRVRVNSLVSSQYLSTVLRSGGVFEQFSLLSRGGTMDVINIGTLSEIDLALPPLEEQLKILLFITDQTRRFDNLVDQAFQGVELLQERRSALISAAVTGKIDVRGWQSPASAPIPELVEEAV